MLYNNTNCHCVIWSVFPIMTDCRGGENSDWLLSYYHDHSCYCPNNLTIIRQYISIYDYGYDIVRICVINYWILLIWWILTNMVMDVMLWYVINCVWLWFFQYDNHYHNNYDCDNYYDGCMDSGSLVYR